MTMPAPPPAGAAVVNHDTCSCHRHHASRRLRLRHTLSGLAHHLRFPNHPTPQQMMSTLGSQFSAMIHHQSYERIENRRPEGSTEQGHRTTANSQRPSAVRADMKQLPPPQLTIVAFDASQQEESLQSPEQELSMLTEKTLLDARCLCLKQLRKLGAESRRAEAASQASAGDSTRQKEESEAKVAACRENIRRWQSRLRVAEAELSRRGLAPPTSASQHSATLDDGYSSPDCPED